MSPARQDVEPLTRKEQIREALTHLAVIAVAFPILFTLGDWWAL